MKITIKQFLFLTLFIVNSGFSKDCTVQAFDGYNVAMRSYLAGNNLEASYFFHCCINFVPNFHLNDKAFYYMSICYRSFGNSQIADNLLDSAKNRDSLEMKSILDRNPLYWLINSDTAKALSALDSTIYPEDISIYRQFIKRDTSSLNFLTFYHPPLHRKIKPYKIFASWRNRFERKYVLDTASINKYILNILITSRTKAFLNYILYKNEEFKLDSIEQPDVMSDIDFITLLIAKSIYYQGLNDNLRAYILISEARTIMNWCFDKNYCSIADSIYEDQKRFFKENFKNINWRYINSKQYREDVKNRVSRFSQMSCPVFESKECQEIYQSIVKLSTFLSPLIIQ